MVEGHEPVETHLRVEIVTPAYIASQAGRELSSNICRVIDDTNADWICMPVGREPWRVHS
jgi:hypothetical protein